MINSRIHFVDRQRKNEIDELRTHAYKNATGFKVDLTTLTWKSSDDDSFIMAAEAHGQILSTMRGEIIAELSLLEEKLECPWSFPIALDMPILLLSRAATLFSHRSLGLNLILRYWFIRFAISHNIRFLVGTFVSGSPREKTLNEMGYQFFENTLGWQKSTYRSLRPVTVVVLDLKAQGEKAIQHCFNCQPNLLEEFPFDGDFPSLRFVGGL